jgi:RNA 2',3'-cyclic 3'-phosphodiesterase
MPDAAAQAALADLQHRIRAALPADAPRHDWRVPAQWHMTLRHLGDSLDDVQRMRVDAAMAQLAPRTTTADGVLAGAQYWPHARVLVAKIDASDALKALLRQLETTVQDCGFAKDRAQTAHITLAYLANRDAPPQPALAWDPMPLHVDRVHLLQTVPGAYRSLASWPLAGASQGA